MIGEIAGAKREAGLKKKAEEAKAEKGENGKVHEIEKLEIEKPKTEKLNAKKLVIEKLVIKDPKVKRDGETRYLCWEVEELEEPIVNEKPFVSKHPPNP